MVILPGFARRLDGGLWTAPPPPLDRVRLDAEITDPPARGSRTIDLDRLPRLAPPATAGGSDVDGTGGLPWPAWLVAALVLLTTALLAWHRLRRSARPPVAAPR